MLEELSGKSRVSLSEKAPAKPKEPEVSTQAIKHAQPGETAQTVKPSPEEKTAQPKVSPAKPSPAKKGALPGHKTPAELEAMKVTEIRRYLRSLKYVNIPGKQISLAKKKELLVAVEWSHKKEREEA